MCRYVIWRCEPSWLTGVRSSLERRVVRTCIVGVGFRIFRNGGGRKGVVNVWWRIECGCCVVWEVTAHIFSPFRTWICSQWFRIDYEAVNSVRHLSLARAKNDINHLILTYIRLKESFFCFFSFDFGFKYDKKSWVFDSCSKSCDKHNESGVEWWK